MTGMWAASLGVLRGQEYGAVSFDCAYDCGVPDPLWQDAVWALPAYAGLFVAWKFLGALAERRREQIPWDRLRLAVPWGATAFALTALALIGVTDFWGVLLIPQLPSVLLLIPFWLILLDTNSWLGVPAALGFNWIGWYLWVRLFEWRAWRDTPSTIGLKG